MVLHCNGTVRTSASKSPPSILSDLLLQDLIQTKEEMMRFVHLKFMMTRLLPCETSNRTRR